MPRLATPGDRSIRGRLDGNPRWAATAVLVAVATVAACDAGAGPPTDPGTSTASPATARTTASVASVDTSVGAAATAVPVGSARVDVEPVEPARLASVTLVCERWGADPPPSIVSCGDAARLALAVLGPAAATVTRLDVGYGEWCAPADAPCGDRSATVASIVARTAPRETVRLRIARVDSGELGVWPPVLGPNAPPVAFDPPPRAAPELGSDAPPDLAARAPFPLCGEEDLGISEAFATAARRCFLTAVLAGSPAELDSHATSTEGDAVLMVYRFAGSGPIRRWVRSSDRWTASACGIAAIDTPAVFEMAGVCVTQPS